MIKEDKNVDFLTTGRQLSEEDFARISEWIKRDKQKKVTRNVTEHPKGQKGRVPHGTRRNGERKEKLKSSDL